MEISRKTRYRPIMKTSVALDRNYEKLYKWASLINSLACIILDGELTSNDLDLANDAIKEVNPYLGAE